MSLKELTFPVEFPVLSGSFPFVSGVQNSDRKPAETNGNERKPNRKQLTILLLYI